MRIADVSSPSGDSQTQLLLSQIDSSIHQAENLSPSDEAAAKVLVSDLRTRLTHLANLVPFSSSLQLQLWKLSYRLWNACVDLSNTTTTSRDDRLRKLIASLRHVAADLLFLAGQPPGVPSPITKCASFYYKTGSVWHDLRRFDAALSCFEKATELIANIDAVDPGERKLFLDLHLARSRTAWELSDFNLAINLLARAKKFLFGCVDHYKALASQYLFYGKCILAKQEGRSDSAKDALKLMNEALELCDKGLAASRNRDEALVLKQLRSKALRFIAAFHLQFEEFESVLKCIKVLRGDGLGNNAGDDHPSLSVLAVKAWLGLGKYTEAEKELKAMASNKGIPEGIWVSAVEAYFQAAGAAGAQTLKTVFLGLLERCQVSAASAVRVVHRLIGDDSSSSLEGSDVRAKVVAELVSEKRVESIFEGEKAAKERITLHSLLWNCAAHHFHQKKYEISAEMFEKSMLYVPHNTENRSLRAKSYRVLCLCHLGLSQLDQAQEYIDVAEKFKIFLQMKDDKKAINQTKAMTACIDFTPDFLSLSAYEAIACHALSVAVASLSHLLDLYSSGKPMATPEVVVLRTIVMILIQSDDQELEILKFIKHARMRMSALGAECFFGKDENGRRERSWLAATSWNIGRKTGKEEKYELCAEFLMLASEFYGIEFGDQEKEDKAMAYKSLILSVSAMLATEKQRNCRLTTLDVQKAGEMLDRAGKMLPSLSFGSGTLVDEQDTAVEANIIFMYTFSAYHIYGRLNDASSQLNIIKKFASSPVCSPDYLLRIGLSASQGPEANYDVASFALNKCLSGFLSSSSPDYQKIAVIVRKLITMSSSYKGETDDDAVYNLYKQIYQVMVGLKEGEYPSEEGKWLAMTAWNRAALPVHLGQFDIARKWMNMGLELASKVSGMQTYKSCMEDFLASFNDKIPIQE